MNTTIEYFDEKAEHCFADAFTITERTNQDRFLAELPAGASILDLGCGSGRDTAYFREKGFVVTPTDGSARMCALASDYLGTPVRVQEFNELADWYQRELVQAGVEVRLGEEATPEKVAELGASAVVVAAGSVPVMPRSIPGIDAPKAMSCNEALTEAGHAKVGRRVVVVGGGLVGCEMALDYCRDGREVTVVEALPDILSAGPSVPSMNANYLSDGFAYHGATVLTNTRLAAITDEGAVVEDAATGQRRTLEADTVVLALGFRPAPLDASAYAATGVDVYQIGDGRQVGNIMTAIWEAYKVARSL